MQDAPWAQIRPTARYGFIGVPRGTGKQCFGSQGVVSYGLKLNQSTTVETGVSARLNGVRHFLGY
jgi:hypothetical protein